jgi:hypothetical protein
MSTLATSRSQVQRIAIMVPLFVGMAWMLGAFVGSRDVETLRASVILSVLVVASLVIFLAAARHEPEGQLLFVTLCVAFAVKLLAMQFRFYTGLLADAYTYDLIGRDISGEILAGSWPDLQRYTGTQVVRLLTGLVYVATGPTFLGISILWTWLGLVGMLFYYKAFATAFPQGHRRLFMLLILLYPSLLLWTSSLSKDALMMLLSGMAIYGLARLQRGMETVGLLLLALGDAGMLAIRPHVAAIFTLAMAASVIVYPFRAGRMTGVVKLGGLLLVAAIAVGVAITASRSVGLERIETEEIQEFISARQSRIAAGGERERAGSNFNPIDTGSPAGLALLIPTVLFRPFPFEAHNFNALVASLEGLGLLGLTIYRWRSVLSALVQAVRNSFLMTTVLYALMLIYLFSAVPNFGIIARQRVQIYPAVLMWVAFLGARERRWMAAEATRMGGRT